jgi:pilus assembly protein CpaB
MNRRLAIIIFCALVLSVCVAYLVYRAVGTSTTAGKPSRSIQVVVATRDLTAGTLVHASDLKMAAWQGPLPKGAILKTGDGLNRGVASPIFENEPVTETRLSAKGSGGGLAATIPPGMRACAVKVNEVVDVAGFVVPGMRVDVLITGLPPGGNPLDGPKVRTLLQNIQVLSAGTNFQGDREGKPEQAQVVNLLVTPSQAEILSLASNETHIQLVLRNPTDTELAKTPGTMMSDLFGGVVQTPSAQALSQQALSQQASSHQTLSKGAPSPIPTVAGEVSRTPASRTAAPAAGPGLYTVDVSNGSVHTQSKFVRPSGNR